MKYILFGIVLSFFSICSGGKLDENADKKEPVIDLDTIKNPASKNCVAKGGKLEMRNSPEGIYGFCKFEDGSECEEWKFFRGECKPGKK